MTFFRWAALPLLAAPLAAQIPEKFTNLKVFPADVPRRQLIDTMRAFTGALGVRCNHCHVGENVTTLEGFDFASDAKETKQAARAMMALTREANAAIEKAKPGAARVGCMTCHHGVTKPETLAARLGKILDEKGTDAAIADYRELRKRYYGRAAYDFGEFSLVQTAEPRLAKAESRGAAVALLKLNLEFYPDSVPTLVPLAEALAASGDKPQAIELMERAAKLQPENAQVKRRLAALKAP